MTLSHDDAQLLQRIAGQDHQALAQLYDRFAGVLLATAVRILRNPDQGAEAVREVFAQIWQQAGAYDPKAGKPFHWILALARQKAIARLKAQNGRYSFVEEVAQETAATVNQRPQGAEEFPGRERSAAIHAAVERLPLEQRQAIELIFLGGMTQNEIVEALDQPPATIKARVRRGLLTLRESLKGAP